MPGPPLGCAVNPRAQEHKRLHRADLSAVRCCFWRSSNCDRPIGDRCRLLCRKMHRRRTGAVGNAPFGANHRQTNPVPHSRPADNSGPGPPPGGVFAQRAHSAGTAPIITVIIQVTTLKTTHLRNHAQSIQNSKIQTSDACHGSQGPKFCPLKPRPLQQPFNDVLSIF